MCGPATSRSQLDGIGADGPFARFSPSRFLPLLLVSLRSGGWRDEAWRGGSARSHGRMMEGGRKGQPLSFDVFIQRINQPDARELVKHINR
eukprot:143071-Chlamydomonas_euryale.AAC.3